MQQALHVNIPVNLLGDFKVNMLSDQSNIFKHMPQRLNLKYIINNATNFTTKVGTCIDLILTNNTSLIVDPNITEPLCSSHCVISVEIKFIVHKQYSYKRMIKH